MAGKKKSNTKKQPTTLKGRKEAVLGRKIIAAQSLKNLDTFDPSIFECKASRKACHTGTGKQLPITLKKIKLALLYIKAGHTIKEACSEAHVSSGSIAYWVADAEENRKALEDCYNARNVIAEDALYNLVKKEKIEAIKFFLQHNNPKYNERTGNNTFMLNVNGENLGAHVKELFGLDVINGDENIIDIDSTVVEN